MNNPVATRVLAMSISIESLGIDRLTVRERLELIEQIWDSLPESVDSQEIPAWHLVELARRMVDAESRPNDGKPCREVLKRLESN